MALPIRDGNQSLTTLSTILVSNSHIPAHTVVSFGTQGITDIATAVSGVELGPNTLNALENITVTLGQVTITGGLTDAQLRASAVTIGGSVTATISGTPSVTFSTAVVTGSTSILNFPATQTVTFTQASVTFSQPTITGSVSVLNFPASQSVTFTTATVTFGTAVITGSTSIIGTPSITFGLISGTVTANPTGTQTIAGTVTAGGRWFDGVNYLPIPFLVTEDGALETVSVLVQPIPAGTNRIGVVTIGAGTVTLGASTSQIGSVTASISGTVPISISSVTIGNSITIGSAVFSKSTGSVSMPTQAVLLGFGYDSNQNFLGVNDQAPLPVQIYSAIPAGTNRIGVVTIGAGTVTIGAGTAQIGSVTIGNTVTIANIQGTTVTTSNFTSTTPSTVLANFSANRQVLTIFNEGAGNLHICAGATCTTIAYQVRLSAGDYYEVPLSQTSLTHSAVFATTGTARVCQVS